MDQMKYHIFSNQNLLNNNYITMWLLSKWILITSCNYIFGNANFNYMIYRTKITQYRNKAKEGMMLH